MKSLFVFQKLSIDYTERHSWPCKLSSPTSYLADYTGCGAGDEAGDGVAAGSIRAFARGIIYSPCLYTHVAVLYVERTALYQAGPELFVARRPNLYWEVLLLHQGPLPVPPSGESFAPYWVSPQKICALPRSLPPSDRCFCYAPRSSPSSTISVFCTAVLKAGYSCLISRQTLLQSAPLPIVDGCGPRHPPRANHQQ